jgi:hypothetical protein
MRTAVNGTVKNLRSDMLTSPLKRCAPEGSDYREAATRAHEGKLLFGVVQTYRRG